MLVKVTYGPYKGGIYKVINEKRGVFELQVPYGTGVVLKRWTEEVIH